jgi:hypothetical protein
VNTSFWVQGDFTYDGAVNTADFNALALNFNQGTFSPLASPALNALVPEPLLLGLLGPLALFVRRLRRR